MAGSPREVSQMMGGPPRGGTADGWDMFACCIPFLKVLGKVMYVVVVGVVALTSWAVLSTCRAPLAYVADPVFCGLVVMLLWSYFACGMEPGKVPRNWNPSGLQDPEAAQGGGGHPQGTDALVRPRFCKKCQAWKPQRAHHCSVAGRCVLRMDHYCVWVLNTVGLLNHKAFLLFILYTMLAAVLAAALLVPSCARFLAEGDIGDVSTAVMLFVTFVFDAAFAISLAGFLILHVRLLQQNKTTIESFEKAEVLPWPYNKGWRRNFVEMFGEDKRRWLVPTHTKAQARLMLERALGDSDDTQRLHGNQLGEMT